MIPAGRHARGCHQRCGSDNGDAQRAGGHAKRPRLLVRQRHHVHAPAQRQQRGGAKRDRAEQRHEIGRADRGKTAEQPERHRRQLIIGIGEIFDEADAGTEQRTDHDAGENQHQHGIARPRRRADHVDGCDGDQPAGEGQRLNGEDAEREKDTEHGTKRGAGGRAQNIGRHQRIAEQALEGGACHGKRSSNQHRRHHARAAHLPDHRFDRGRDIRRSAGELGCHHREEITEGNGETAGGECEQQSRDQDQE
jgi:hypothetical protein